MYQHNDLEQDSRSDMSSASNYSEHKCHKCGKPFANKYTLRRHLNVVHGIATDVEKTRETVSNDAKGEEEEEDEEEEEGNDYIWRRMMKNTLRDWHAAGHGYREESSLLTPENLDAIRQDMRSQIDQIIRKHDQLMNSPMYQKICKTKDKLQRTMYDSDDDDDEVLDQAFRVRKKIINACIEENGDAVRNFSQSTNGESEDDEDNNEEKPPPVPQFQFRPTFPRI
jgi:hypothetical protein